MSIGIYISEYRTGKELETVESNIPYEPVTARAHESRQVEPKDVPPTLLKNVFAELLLAP
jgi:hypothetical protein